MQNDQTEHGDGALALVQPGVIRGEVFGYRTLVPVEVASIQPDTTTEDYAHEQSVHNIRKTLDYLMPILRAADARTVVDVGCGIGTMVATLLQQGFDAYGTDLPGLSRFWHGQDYPRERFFVVDAYDMRLPFKDNSLDFAYTLGVIEHVGTADGHSERLPEYRSIRKAWLREIFRVLKPGGHMLIGGPNRNFPVDVAHGPDSRASGLELKLSRWCGATVHKTWGENFLLSYRDFDEYLAGCAYRMTPLGVSGYVGYSRVPGIFRPLVEAYVAHMPKSLLGTGFNPWVMALIQKTEQEEKP